MLVVDTIQSCIHRISITDAILLSTQCRQVVLPPTGPVTLHYFRTIIAASFNIIGTNLWWVVYTCSDHYLLWLMHKFSQHYFLDYCFVLHIYLPCKCNTFQHYPIIHEFLLYVEFWNKFHCCGEWLKLLLQTDCSASDDSDDTDSTDLSICFEVNGAAVVPSINPSSLSDDTVSSISEWCIPNISLATNFSSANAHLSDALGSLLLNWKHVKISISRFL